MESKYRYGCSKVMVIDGVEMMYCFDRKLNCWKVVEVAKWHKIANEEVSDESKIRSRPTNL